MQLAQSYLQGQGSPFDGVLEAYGMGQKLRQNRDLLQAQQAEQARKIQAQQQLEQIDWNDQNAIAQVVAQFPEYTKGAKDYYDALEQKEQQGLLTTMSRGISALQSGANQVASDLFRAQAEGYRNRGDEDSASGAEWLAEQALINPSAAQRTLMMNYAVLSPEKSGANLENYGKALNPQRKEVDTGDQVQSYAIDPVTGEVSGAEWIADKGINPDEQLRSDTSIANTTQTNMVSEGNNIRTNTVNEGNNIRSNNTSRLNAQDAADVKKYGIDIGAKNAANILEARRQEAEIASKKGKHQSFGGKVYVVYPDGTATPALDAQGNQMTDTKVDPTIQRDIRNEKVRIGKLNAILPEAEALLKNATGSRTGAALDSGARLFGYSTDGAKTTAQLEVLAGQLVSMMPRMEGPQSDKDVAMYKAMAGNIADPTKTVAERQAALETIKRMTQKAEADLARSEKQAGQPSGASRNDVKRSSLFN